MWLVAGKKCCVEPPLGSCAGQEERKENKKRLRQPASFLSLVSPQWTKEAVIPADFPSSFTRETGKKETNNLLCLRRKKKNNNNMAVNYPVTIVVALFWISLSVAAAGKEENGHQLFPILLVYLYCIYTFIRSDRDRCWWKRAKFLFFIFKKKKKFPLRSGRQLQLAFLIFGASRVWIQFVFPDISTLG